LSFILPDTLAEANKRADDLALKLEQSEKARKKAESDAAAVEDLRKRLHDAETSLSENIAQQSDREKEILTRLESQSRRSVSKYSDHCYFFGSSFFTWRAFLTSFLLLI
jgi:septal ring factor EnvC (AmiA/AmiB activator)